MTALFLHGSRYHSLTLVSMSHSYETVASILGQSSSGLAKADNQPMAVSSMDLTDKTLTHSDDFFLQLMDNTTPIQKLEGQFEDIHIKHITEYPTSIEPYMWDLAGGRTATPSPTTDSDDGFLVCTSMKKWPPLNEADISEISKDKGEEVEEQEVTLHQDSVQTTVDNESLLARHQTETGQDKVRALPTSSQLDKG